MTGRGARYGMPDFPLAKHHAEGRGHLKLEIDETERRAIKRSLAERRSRLIERTGDTLLTPARRQASRSELSAIWSVLRKLRWGRRPTASIDLKD
jgi:hypothetical protein